MFDYKAFAAGLLIEKVIESTGDSSWKVEKVRSVIEAPKDSSHGDLAFPCFQLAKALKKAPQMISKDFEIELMNIEGAKEVFSSITALGPYLNFKINRAHLCQWMIPSVLDSIYLKAREKKPEKMMIEYSQPNTHKAFHVGHARNVALGDALVRICEWEGYPVVAANYIGDVGTHVAKCLWYYEKYFEGEIPKENLGEFLGGLYVKANNLTDYKRLSKTPFGGIRSAHVEKIEDIPDKKKVKKVVLSTGSENVVVVCGGIEYKVGDIVAYAGPGSKVLGRLVFETEKYGIKSQGMLCSEAELEITENKEKIYVFDREVPLGEEIAEINRVPGAIDESQKVLDVIKERESQISNTLKRLESKEKTAHELWEKTREWSLNDFKKTYEWLDARFDHYFFESGVGSEGKELVKKYYEKGVFKKSEGAIGIEFEDKKIPFFLLLKSDGTGLYSTKDLALAIEKFEKFNIDRSIYVVDIRQALHFQQVFKTLEAMGYEQGKKCYHLQYGYVQGPDGNMSSRKGNVILFSELKKRLTDKINQDFLSKYKGDWPDPEIENAARRIAISTIRYGMLNQESMKNIVFDMEAWTSQTGNTGPYLMYAYARTRSILKEIDGYDFSKCNWDLLIDESEEYLLLQMLRFPEFVERAAESYEPYIICQFVYDFAKSFSRMYSRCPVKKAESEELKHTRAALVDAVGRVIKCALGLIGIHTIERM